MQLCSVFPQQSLGPRLRAEHQRRDEMGGGAGPKPVGSARRGRGAGRRGRLLGPQGGREAGDASRRGSRDRSVGQGQSWGGGPRRGWRRSGPEATGLQATLKGHTAEGWVRGSGRGYGNTIGAARSRTGVGSLELAGLERESQVCKGDWGFGAAEKRRVRCAAGRRPDGCVAVPSGGRAGGGRPVRPQASRAGAGPGGTGGALAPLVNSAAPDLRSGLRARARRRACGLLGPRPPAPGLRPRPSPPPAARPGSAGPMPAGRPGPPPNPRGGRRRRRFTLLLLCVLGAPRAGSGAGEYTAPCSSFPPGPKACAPGATAGGGGAGATWTAREQRKAPPERPSGRPHLWGARRRRSWPEGPASATEAFLPGLPCGGRPRPPGGQGAATWDLCTAGAGGARDGVC